MPRSHVPDLTVHSVGHLLISRHATPDRGSHIFVLYMQLIEQSFDPERTRPFLYLSSSRKREVFADIVPARFAL